MSEGKLTYGSDLTTRVARIRLAQTENPYRPISRMLLPERNYISGASPEDQTGDVYIRRWSQNRWDLGELKGLWESGGYRQSANVKPDREGDRLELGAFKETAQHDGAADFSEGIKFGRALSSLWAVDDGTAHEWQLATDDFDQTGRTTGATTQTATSMTDEGDGLGLLIAYDDKSIRRVRAADNLEVYSATASDAPTYNAEIRYSQGVIYYLDGADLYSLTTPAIGDDWTFDFTGGASEDLWTSSTAHGLSVDDALNFTTDGGGADEYAVDTRYWVVSVPSTTTATLSATKGGAAVAGSADSSGNWAAEQIDKRTVLSQPGGIVNDYMTGAGNIYRRMCVTDVGVAWLIPQEDGTTIIQEYNAKNDTDFASGKLPVEFAFPYSIHFAHGFLFVGYRYAAAHGEKGTAHIYYQRGGQWGSTGEVRLADTTTASQPVVIAGVIGDDLIFWYGLSLMAYDLSAGALFQVAQSAATSTGVTDAMTFGKDIFVANTDGSAAVERFDTTLYSTSSSASWKSGRFDFDLPGIKKTLLRVTAVTDGLAALTSMTCKVSADGKTFTAVPGTHEDDGVTTFTWTVSQSGNVEEQTTGYDFEIELIPLTTSSAVSPKVREIFCEAISAQKRRGVEIDVDLGSDPRGKGASGTALLAELRAASEYAGGICEWTDPFAVAEHEAPRVSDVMVELMGGHQDQRLATIRIWETELA